MATAPRKRGVATLVGKDGAKIRFDFDEAEDRVAAMLCDFLQSYGLEYFQNESDEVLLRETASKLIEYVARIAISMKATQKYKPWKDNQGSGKKGVANASTYRAGFYDGWAALQAALSKEILKTEATSSAVPVR